MNSNTNNAKTAIDFRTLPDFIPSMCIPRVYPNISEGRIRKIFDELNIGVIERINIVTKTTEKGEKFNRVFIHMERWFHNSNASVARERLLGGKDIKIIYDDPWFWKVSAYKPSEGSSNNNNSWKKTTIQFDSSSEEEKEKERKQPTVTDIKPLTVSRPNNNGCNKTKREDISYQREETPIIVRPSISVKEEKRPPIIRDSASKIVAHPVVIASTKNALQLLEKEPFYSLYTF